MREILELCVRLDTAAATVYKDMSDECAISDLADVFRRMSLEEQQHVEWWVGLRDAWDEGLVPDIADEHDLRARLTNVAAAVDEVLREQSTAMLTPDSMLELAAQLEFFMLDPVFGELTDLMQPGGTINARDAYGRHVARLVEAIQVHYHRSSIASLLAAMLTRAYADQVRLAALASRDQLTGLYNRRGLLGHVKQWLSWSERYGRPVAIVLVDVDNFKRINDTYGHQAGDEALIGISRALEAALRSSDVVGRVGGDEFLILTPETDETELVTLMERIVTTVSASPIAAGEETLLLSVSVGGAWTAGGAHVETEAAIAAADRSLYSAKEAGRGRAGEPMAAGPALIH